MAKNLAKKYNSEINSYSLKFDNSFFEKTKSFIKNHFYFSYRKVYKSFGATTHIIPKKKLLVKKKKFKRKILNRVKSKDDIFKITIENINIGDLIYDGYLRKYNLPTIDINSKNFKNYLLNVIDLFFFGFNILKIMRLKLLF